MIHKKPPNPPKEIHVRVLCRYKHQQEHMTVEELVYTSENQAMRALQRRYPEKNVVLAKTIYSSSHFYAYLKPKAA